MTEDLDEELESFAFARRYPPGGNGRRMPKGDSIINAYVYTVRRFKRFRNGGEVTPGAVCWTTGSTKARWSTTKGYPMR